MKNSGFKLVLIAFVAILAQVGYVHANALIAKPRGKVSQATSTDGTSAQSDSSLLPVAIQQKAPEPVIVKYQDGELTIESFNAPLNDILRAVCQRTGALIRIPQDTNERITRNIGPGPVINVLGDLLYESGFNYLIEESGRKQGAPVRVTLSIKGSSSRALRLAAAQSQTAAMAWANRPEAEEARQKGMADRGQLLREIASLHLQFREESLMGKLRQ